MRRFLIPILSVFACVIASDAAAQTAEQVKFWKKAVSEKTFSDIAIYFSGTSSPPWPKAGSKQALQKLAGSERDLSSDAGLLVESLRAKVAAGIRGDGNVALAEVEQYCVVAAGLDRAGGYNNMVLADGMRRVAMFYLSGILVHGTVPLNQVQKQAERLTVPRVNVRTLAELLVSEDQALAAHRAQFERINPDQNVFTAISLLDVGDPITMNALSLTQLLNESSGAALIVRLTGTELLYTVSLRGLFSFLEKGGTNQELNPADIRAFKSRMGGAESSFQYQLLNVRYLSVGHVRSLFEIHESAIARKAFLRSAIE